MATDHLSVTFKGLCNTLSNAQELNDTLNDVFSYYAYGRSECFNMPGMLTISALIGDSTTEDPIHNESLQTDILPTSITLVCDTILSDDSNTNIADTGKSLLDHEYDVLRALQSDAWWNAEGSHHGWIVAGIERDVPVLLEDGGIDPDVRRFEITLLVDVLLDRTDGPGR